MDPISGLGAETWSNGTRGAETRVGDATADGTRLAGNRRDPWIKVMEPKVLQEAPDSTYAGAKWIRTTRAFAKYPGT